MREFSDQTIPNPTSPLSFNTTAGVGRDAAGNVYVAGACVGNLTIGPPPTTTPRQDPDVFIAKYTPAGTLVWVRTLYSSSDEAALDIVVSPAGRCTIAGRYSGTSGLSFASFGSSLVLPRPPTRPVLAPCCRSWRPSIPMARWPGPAALHPLLCAACRPLII